ncbi:MAG: ARMT1-like domain-containing protein [Syntrophaceticus sp.]|nr:ARMT1-like domain-containing protein [Syntrophaceticus sp.]
MRSTIDCVPCYIKQVISALRIAGLKEREQHVVINELFSTINQLDPAKTPAENSSLVLFEAYRLMGIDDPFKEAKAASNKLAHTFLPALERIIAYSEDALLTALKTSVAGNTIDMGINPHYDVGASISKELERRFERNDFEVFREVLGKGGPMVIIGDNSGEIFFDYILMANLRSFTEEMFYVVKGGPILNDATMEDVEDTGISNLAKIITTGNNYLGVIPENCSEEMCSAIESASIVLSKGQANYETLEATSFAGDKTFFLLQAKCPVIAKHLGVKMGDSVLVRNRPS